MLKITHWLASIVRLFKIEEGAEEGGKGELGEDGQMKLAHLHSLCIGNVAYGRLGAPLILNQRGF